MTRRREQTVELAEALGLAVDAGEATTDLMDRCIERAEALRGIEPLEPELPPERAEAKPKARKGRKGQSQQVSA